MYHAAVNACFDVPTGGRLNARTCHSLAPTMPMDVMRDVNRNFINPMNTCRELFSIQLHATSRRDNWRLRWYAQDLQASSEVVRQANS